MIQTGEFSPLGFCYNSCAMIFWKRTEKRESGRPFGAWRKIGGSGRRLVRTERGKRRSSSVSSGSWRTENGFRARIPHHQAVEVASAVGPPRATPAAAAAATANRPLLWPHETTAQPRWSMSDHAGEFQSSKLLSVCFLALLILSYPRWRGPVSAPFSHWG